MSENDNVGSAQIKAFAERLIRMLEESEALASDIKEIRAEAKGSGYSVKALNQAVKIARMTPDQRSEHENFQMELDLYVTAVLGGDE